MLLQSSYRGNLNSSDFSTLKMRLSSMLASDAWWRLRAVPVPNPTELPALTVLTDLPHTHRYAPDNPDAGFNMSTVLKLSASFFVFALIYGETEILYLWVKAALRFFGDWKVIEELAYNDWLRWEKTSSQRGDVVHLQVKLLTIGIVNNLVFLLDNDFYLTK